MSLVWGLPAALPLDYYVVHLGGEIQLTIQRYRSTTGQLFKSIDSLLVARKNVRLSEQQLCCLILSKKHCLTVGVNVWLVSVLCCLIILRCLSASTGTELWAGAAQSRVQRRRVQGSRGAESRGAGEKRSRGAESRRAWEKKIAVEEQRAEQSTEKQRAEENGLHFTHCWSGAQ